MRFHAHVKGIRRKELPELNDEFAKDLGDYQSLDELKEPIRKTIFAERQYEAQQEAKNKLVESLVDLHDFPVPEVYIERQIQNRMEQLLRTMQSQGTDLKNLNLDWQKVKEAQRDKATARGQGFPAARQGCGAGIHRRDARRSGPRGGAHRQAAARAAGGRPVSHGERWIAEPHRFPYPDR